MRAYFFGNMYLSSIQQGIQAQHTTAELFLNYPNPDDVQTAPVKERYAGMLLYDWARNHKTSILLNGGYSSALHELVEKFANRENPYPWAFFNEGYDALDGALTCVGIVLPEKIYGLASALRGPEAEETEKFIREHGEWFSSDVPADPNDCSVPHEISKFELELALELNKYGLAK